MIPLSITLVGCCLALIVMVLCCTDDIVSAIREVSDNLNDHHVTLQLTELDKMDKSDPDSWGLSDVHPAPQVPTDPWSAV